MLIKKKFDERFTNLFTPGYIGNLWIKNRVIRTSLSGGMALSDGSIGTRIVDHYKEVARGEVGMVNVEYCYIDDDASKAKHGQIGISNSKHQSGLYWLANAIKNEGARAAVQLAHAGRQRFSSSRPYKSAYRRAWPDLYNKGGLIPDEMTIEEIEQCIEDFGVAALRAKEAGFDVCEVHGGHGYLITNFLSPWNQRNDWYGGHFENRKRFLLQVFESMRRKVGSDYPLGVRLSGTDYDPVNPIPVEETIQVAKDLESLGVDYIHVSGGTHEFGHKETVVMYYPMAYQLWACEEIKKAVGIPVICSGSLGDPELAENILKEGKADFIGLGRPLIADPYWSQKAQEGHPEDIRPCIRCMQCNDKGVTAGYLTCTVNATAGREGELCTIPAAVKPKKVAIIGGGPSGMEAARVAALKGHEVTLYEKRELGGMLIEASVPDNKADIRRLINYYIAQMKKHDISIIYEEATIDKIKQGNYDTVVVAAGSKPIIPNIPGMDRDNVVQGLDILHGAETGQNVVVVGGGMVGCEIAAFLAEKGKQLTVIEATDQIAAGLSNTVKKAFIEIIGSLPIRIKCGRILSEITDEGVITISGLKKEIFNADTVVIATGFRPEQSLWRELCKIPDIEAFAIGDCAKVQTSYEAIHDGYNTAFSLIK